MLLSPERILGNEDKENEDIENEDIENEDKGNEDIENEETDKEERDILKSSDNPKIYIKRVLKSKTDSSQPKKKHDRVYNSKQACLYCNNLFLHLPVHLMNKHIGESEVAAAKEKDDKTRFDLIKKKGNNKHNQEVLKEGKGELILARRPKEAFMSSDYGPCPNCLEWLNVKTLQRHQKKCKSFTTTEIAKKPSKKVLQLKSDIISGRYGIDSTSKFQKEVYSIMTRDKITDLAKKDKLIVSLGESWYKRSVGNPKRKYFASQHMRLMSRLLINLRSLIVHSEESSTDVNGSIKEKTALCEQNANLSLEHVDEEEVSENTTQNYFMWDLLDPMHFEKVTKASIMCTFPYMDDIEDLKSPSNAIKLKYDLVRMLDMKWSFIQEKGGGIGADRCDIFQRQIKIHWNESVTRLARAVLLNRSLVKEVQIPAPEDIKKLTIFITDEVKKIDISDYKTDNFRNTVRLAQTRLLLFNKRRSGEIDHIT